MDPTFKGFSPPTPQRQPTGGPSFKLILGIVGVALVLLIIIAVASNFIGSSTTNTSQRLLYRLDALQSLTTTAAKNITDDDLSTTNASLSLVLTGDVTAVKEVISTKKANKELNAIKTEEADQDALDRLSAAKVNGTYDTTYRTILREKLQSTYALAGDIAKRATTAQKAALATLQEHLGSYYDQLVTPAQ